MWSLSSTADGDVADADGRNLGFVGLEESDVIKCVSARESKGIWK